MKKLIKTAAAALIAVVVLTGCGSEKEIALKDMDVEKYVTLGEYKGIEVPDPLAIDEMRVKMVADSLYFSAAYNEGIPIEGGITDRPVEIGDTISIDYVGTQDGVAFGGGTAEGYYLTIGSGQFIDGFEDGLVGVMPGENVDLNLSFPERYSNPNLAGQAVVFNVTVNRIMPEDRKTAIVALIGIDGVTNMDELIRYVHDWMYSSAAATYDSTVQSSVLESFIDSCSFGDIPKVLLTRYGERIRTNVEAQAGIYGMDAETFIASVYGRELDSYVEECALKAAWQNVAMQAVANREGLAVSDEELQELLQQYAALAGYATVEEYVGELSMEDYREYFMYDKVLEFLVENARLVD